MKKAIVFLGLLCFPQLVFLQIPAYVFNTGQDIAAELPNGFFKSSEELLNKTIVEADIKTRSQTELEMITNGKRGYAKYSDLKDEYMGVIFKKECYRFYPSQAFKNNESFDPEKKYGSWSSFNVKLIGPLCLYTETTYNPISIAFSSSEEDENGDSLYHYSYGAERTREFAISNGLQGDIYNATAENFMKVIADDEELLNSFKSAFNQLKPKPSLSIELSVTQDAFQLFVTYFEAYNNKHNNETEEK